MRGQITAIKEVTAGTELATAASATDTELDVLDIYELDFEGGQLQIGNESHSYTVDPDTEVTTLASPLVGAYDEEEPVYIYPLTVERIAYLLAPDQEEELAARVPHALYERLPIGIRVDGGGEYVEADLIQDEMVVLDVLGQVPDIDGTYIDPDTLPEPELTDGDPPGSSPTPTVVGGPGYLAVKWTAISNADLVTYDVHLSTTTGFTADGSNLVGSINGTLFFIRKTVAGADLSYGTTYYVKLIARDEDGSAAAGSQGSSQMVQVDTPDIALNAVTANEINVADLSAISADLGTITAGMVTGATFRTSSGLETVMDSTGIHMLTNASTTPAGSNGLTWLDSAGFYPASGVYVYRVADYDYELRAYGVPAFGSTSQLTIIDSTGQSEFVRSPSKGNATFKCGVEPMSVSTAVSKTETVTHGLGGTPTSVVATCDATAGAGTTKVMCTVSAINSTTFDLSIRAGDSTNLNGNYTVYWMAGS